MQENTTLSGIIKLLRQQLPDLNAQYQVRSLRMFGSYVRQTQTVDSDLDLLVTFDKAPSLLKFIALENRLTDMLGVKVDLVMKDTLKPRIGKHVMSEVVVV